MGAFTGGAWHHLGKRFGKWVTSKSERLVPTRKEKQKLNRGGFSVNEALRKTDPLKVGSVFLNGWMENQPHTASSRPRDVRALWA